MSETPPEPELAANAPALESFTYNDKVVRNFIIAAMVFGLVGLGVGLLIALQLCGVGKDWGISFLNFGRLRPLHTNAVIFGFTGNALFAGIYYSMQRLLKTRLWSDALASISFWGWNLIIVLAAITLPLGITTSKEYAELEWPIDVLITIVWVIITINVFATCWIRRERHLYVGIWFYIATFLGIAMLHVGNSLALPVSLTKSYPVYAGVQDAMVQWWYGHNAVAFFLTFPILGLMYYFLPKAAKRPVYSYRLSILHFWSLIFIYVWAGPHHLLNSAVPEWAQSLAMVFSIMLWMPSWGGMVNGLLTLRGAWDKVRSDPILKFFVVAVTLYGMATFEGPLLSIRSVNAISHNTDWTIGHVHSGALGWVGFMMFGMFYWLMPRLYKTKLYSVSMANWHFWIATVGIVIYAVTMWIAGIQSAAMQFQLDENGAMVYTDWMDIQGELTKYYWLRALGGGMYLFGAILCSVNLFMTTRGKKMVEVTDQAAPLTPDPDHRLMVKGAFATKGRERVPTIHGLFERWPLLLVTATAITISIGGIVELLPGLVRGAATPDIATVQPYRPLELEGRDIYIREGCNNCHTQQVRTLRPEVLRYQGIHSQPGEGKYERPHLWGSKRTGPDLAREGLIRDNIPWQFMHLVDPRITSEASTMPSYDFLAQATLDTSSLATKLRALTALGHPYTDADRAGADAELVARAAAIANELRANGDAVSVMAEYDIDPATLEQTEIVALIAYLVSLGKDVGPNAVVAAATEGE